MVRKASTVCVAESSCQPNHSSGSSHSQRVPGQRDLPESASQPPASTNGGKSQLIQCVGHASANTSANEAGGMILWSRMTGLPNFQIASPRNSPNKKRVNCVPRPAGRGEVGRPVAPKRSGGGRTGEGLFFHKREFFASENLPVKGAISANRLPARALPGRWCAATAAFVPGFADFPAPGAA